MVSKVRAILGALVSSMVWPAVAVAASTVTPSPSVGPPTTSVKATLAGFPASRLVDVYFDTTDQCLVLVDGAGGGACTFAVAASAQPGTHWITAVARGANTGVQTKYLVRSDWSDAHGPNSRHDGFNPWENTVSKANAGLLEPVWSKSTLSITGSPVVVGGIVYVVDTIGKLWAFNADSGAKIAGFPKSAGSATFYGNSPVVSGGKVYVVAYSNAMSATMIYAFNAATGQPVSGFPKALGGLNYGSPVVVSGKLYIGASDGKLYGFNALTGATLTNYPVTVGGGLFATPTFYNGILYLGSTDNNLYAYSASTATKVFSVATTGNFDITGTAVSGNLLYFGSASEHKIYQANPATGSVTWPAPFALANSWDGTPAIAYGNVYVIDWGGIVSAIDTATGTANWTRTFSGTSGGAPSITVANGVLYTGDGAHVHVLDASNGRTLKTLGNGLGFEQAPVVVNGTVFATYVKGGLVAYRPKGVASASTMAARPAISALKPDPSLRPQ